MRKRYILLLPLLLLLMAQVTSKVPRVTTFAGRTTATTGNKGYLQYMTDSNDCVSGSGTGVLCVSNGSANVIVVAGTGGGGTGTVTSIATTSPITGGTITGIGTIACATCVVNNGANTYSTGNQSMAAATFFEPPAGSGYTANAGGFGYDTADLSYSLEPQAALKSKVWTVLAHTTSTTDVICSLAADVISGITCSNQVTDGTTETSFTQTFQVPASFLKAGKVIRVTSLMRVWSHSAAASIEADLRYGGTAGQATPGGTQIFRSNGVQTIASSQSGQSMKNDCLFSAVSGGASASLQGGCGWAFSSWTTTSNRNIIVQPVTSIDTTSAKNLTLSVAWIAASVASGTYTSGITAVGTAGQTCALTSFNNSSTATATVALTGVNTIAGGTALVITARGAAATAAPTSATAGNGTATCSGTATIATVLGGATGNAVQLLDVLWEGI